jgi:hypothetical protein
MSNHHFREVVIGFCLLGLGLVIAGAAFIMRRVRTQDAWTIDTSFVGDRVECTYSPPDWFDRAPRG